MQAWLPSPETTSELCGAKLQSVKLFLLSSCLPARDRCMRTASISRPLCSSFNLVSSSSWLLFRRSFTKSPNPAAGLQRAIVADMAATHPPILNKKAHPFTREAFEDVMRQRFFYCQAFEIYGGEYYASHLGGTITTNVHQLTQRGRWIL